MQIVVIIFPMNTSFQMELLCQEAILKKGHDLNE